MISYVTSVGSAHVAQVRGYVYFAVESWLYG